jgi:hypothetical protein
MKLQSRHKKIDLDKKLGYLTFYKKATGFEYFELIDPN